MKKYLLICIAALIMTAAILFALLYRGNDHLNAFERVNCRQLLNENIFNNEADETVYPQIAASVGCEGSAVNTYLGSKTQLKSEADFIELNVCVKDGVVYLADSIKDINIESTEMLKVIREMKKEYPESGIIANIENTEDADPVITQLSLSKLNKGYYITCRSEEELFFFNETFGFHNYLCTYSNHTENDFSTLQKNGAAGLLVESNKLSEKLISKIRNSNLFVVADCGSSVYVLIKALAFGADIVITDHPSLAKELVGDPSLETVDIHFADARY